MPHLFVCEQGHARLPDAWEPISPPDSLGPCVLCGASVSLQDTGPDTDPRPVTTPPGYEIIRPVGGATMASVYKARHLASGQEAALKISRSAGDRGRLRREALVLSELSHPHVVRWL